VGGGAAAGHWDWSWGARGRVALGGPGRPPLGRAPQRRAARRDRVRRGVRPGVIGAPG
jgi:hypothetical protein